MLLQPGVYHAVNLKLPLNLKHRLFDRADYDNERTTFSDQKITINGDNKRITLRKSPYHKSIVS